MKNQINMALEETCRKGLAEGCFCGVSASVSFYKNNAYHRSFFCGGKTRSDKAGSCIERNTLFDLASLTKPLCTTLCILFLIGTKQLQWEDSYSSSLELNRTFNKEDIKIYHLLCHSSGLPPYKPYYKQFPAKYSKYNKELIIQKILEESLAYQTGSICRYSDLGFMLLGALIEKKTGLSIDTLFRLRITDPLRISPYLRFLPLKSSLLINKNNIAATEECGWRQKILQGEVHDENGWVMGGVAGHAGLFGTIEAVMTLCEKILDMWKVRSTHPAFSQALLQHAVSDKHSNGSWCLGFDTPTKGQSSSGSYFAANSIGHLGFSGTSFWIDPEKQVIVVLLTNRIHPSRENMRIREFRPFFHDYIMKSILSRL